MRSPANLLFNALLLVALASAFPLSFGAQGSPEPPEVKLQVKLIEIAGLQNKQLGFDWYTGHAPGKISGSNQTPDIPQATATGTNTVGTLTGILSDPQFRTVVSGLEQRGNTRLLASPEAVTVSGQPLMIQRPDGWTLKIVPTVSTNSGQLSMSVELSQDKGEYAGFHLSSVVRSRNDESAIFSDIFQVPQSRKGSSPEPRRLILMVTPHLDSKTQH